MSEMSGWKTATPQQRVAMLQAVENRNAAQQNRPAARIQPQYMASNRRGSYSRQRNAIVMNHDMIAYSDSPNMCLQNLYHEGRHAQQWDAVQHPERHPEFSKETVGKWKDNMANYKTYTPEKLNRQLKNGTQDMTPTQANRVKQNAHKRVFETYQKQPIEVDARRYAKERMEEERRLELPPQKEQVQARERTAQNLSQSTAKNAGKQAGKTGPAFGNAGLAVGAKSSGQGMASGAKGGLAGGPKGGAGHGAGGFGGMGGLGGAGHGGMGGAGGFGGAGHGGAGAGAGAGGHGGGPGGGGPGGGGGGHGGGSGGGSGGGHGGR